MENDAVIRKPGRGKDKQPRKKRTDTGVQPMPGDNTRYLTHDLKLYRLPKIDMNDPVAVHDRVDFFFALCAEDDIKPSIESLALAFGVGRATLFNWLNEKTGAVKNPKSLDTLKEAYTLINSYYSHMMNNGKINPVAGIFLMKNNMGYKDTTDYIITANQENTLSLTDIADRAGLLDE